MKNVKDLLGNVQKCFEGNKIFYSQHARNEMLKEEFGRIYENETFEAIIKGEVVEYYPKDNPYPSILIFGKTRDGRPLHVLSAYSKKDNIAIIITVYQPNPKLWIDYRRRRK